MPNYEGVTGIVIAGISYHTASRAWMSSQNLQGLRHTIFLAWHGQDVHNYVERCHLSQITKYMLAKSQAILQPLPILQRPWVDITVDFIIQLPKSARFTTILVVVDRFSKAVHFEVLKSGFTAKVEARVFINSVVKLHDFLVL